LEKILELRWLDVMLTEYDKYQTNTIDYKFMRSPVTSLKFTSIQEKI